MKKQKTPRGLF